MEIERIERYRVDGKEFKELKDVHIYAENKIGTIVDKITKACPPAVAKDIGKIFDVLVDKENREELRKYLNIEIELNPPNHFVPGQAEFTNILDMFYRDKDGVIRWR